MAKCFKLISPLLYVIPTAVFGQANQGELRLHVTDPMGAGVRTTIHLSSEANQYHADLETDKQGKVDAARLPFGIYRLEVDQAGFAPVNETVAVRSTIPVRHSIGLKIATVETTVSVKAATTLIDPEQPGSVDQVGPTLIQRRVGTVPGRSLEDLVNSQPGWLFEGNAVLHPRGSENETQFVVDGIPLMDNRSPSFGPEIGAEDVQSVSIYTAGIPAEYGRKLGGVVEVNTERPTQPGLHGELGLSGGTFNSGSAFAQGQYTAGKNTVGGSASGSRTDHYLNPVVPQNYTNSGTLGDFSIRCESDVTSGDRVGMTARHELARYQIPNEQIQRAAGQRQMADNIETIGVASAGKLICHRQKRLRLRR